MCANAQKLLRRPAAARISQKSAPFVIVFNKLSSDLLFENFSTGYGSIALQQVEILKSQSCSVCI